MKTLKFILFSACCLSLFNLTSADAQVQKNRFQINGDLGSGAAAPSKLYLFLSQKLADSVLVKKGLYHFSGNITGVEPALIKASNSYPLDKNHSISFLVNNQPVNILSDKDLKNIVLSGPGSTIGKDYREAIKNSLLLTDTLSGLMADPGFLENRGIQSRVRIRTAYMTGQMTDQMRAYIKLHPESMASGYMLTVVAEHDYPSIEATDKLLKTLPADQQSWAKNKIVAFRQKKEAEILAKQKEVDAANLKRRALEDETAIGKIAKDFTQTDTLDKPISLSSFRGKYVLVDFWASWCGPCRAENPNVVKVFNEYKDKGFNVLGISLDGGGSGSRMSWLAAIKKDGLQWTQLSDLKGWENEVAKLYNVNAIPRNFLIDPNGVIIGKDLRGQDLEKKIASLFK